MPLAVGDVFDRYTILGLLGRGGMGEVYRAHDARLERTVALKLLRVSDDDDPRATSRASVRLLREARAAAAFEHANAVTIHDVGEVDGVPYIAMELVSGHSLRTYVGDPEVTLATKVRWLVEIGRALAAAHRRGLVHRDIKPENVMVRDDGAIKVLDFGIADRAGRDAPARAATGSADARGIATLPTTTTDPWTQEGALVGTPRYMAPEQLRGEALDARGDQFAWGVVAYELFTGAAPFGGDVVSLTLVSSVLGDEPAAAAPLQAVVPPQVAAVVLRALEKGRDARYPSIDEAVTSLEGALAASLASGRSGGPSREERTEGAAAERPARGGRRVAFLGLLAVALVAGVAVTRARSHDVVHPLPVASAGDAAPDGASEATVRLTDLPTPASDVAEARAEYVAALHAIRGASVVPGVKHLVRATELDPNLAAAHMRLLAYGRGLNETDVPAHFQKARELQGLLTPRDQSMLRALEPLFLETPPNEAEVTRRLEALAATAPRDVELQYLASSRDMDPERVVARLDALLLLDPGHAVALWRAANVPLATGDLPRAATLLDRCLAVAPDATSCLTVRTLVFEELGRCADMERDARRLAYLSPSARSHDLVARVLFANGAPEPAVRDALARKWATSAEPARTEYIRDDETHLAILRGDFATAERLSLQSLATAAPSDDEEDHKNVVLPLLEIYGEQGKVKDAAALAARYLDARASWRTAGAWSPVPLLSSIAARGGLRKPAEVEAARAQWLQLWSAVDPAFRSQSWVLGYAQPAATKEEATLALSVAPHPLPRVHGNQFHREGLSVVGKVLLLGGKVSDAVPELRMAAGSCSALQAPIEHTQARYLFGRALEETGDIQGACQAFRDVLARWGEARPRSVTAEGARAHARALACP
jgi:serine/threonine-protein kinase